MINMKLGLVTDIHNDIHRLREAIELLQQQGIDQLITLGDTCDAFLPPEGSDEVASLLMEQNALGVWGNHDYIFCHEPSAYLRENFSDPTFEFMATTTPHLNLDDCYFSHLESSVDQHDPVALWKLHEPDFEPLAFSKDAFETLPITFQFTGHYHCWFAATPDGQIEWNGSDSLEMSGGIRHFVIIRAVMQKSCAIFDTDSKRLTPINW